MRPVILFPMLFTAVLTVAQNNPEFFSPIDAIQMHDALPRGCQKWTDQWTEPMFYPTAFDRNLVNHLDSLISWTWNGQYEEVNRERFFPDALGQDTLLEIVRPDSMGDSYQYMTVRRTFDAQGRWQSALLEQFQPDGALTYASRYTYTYTGFLPDYSTLVEEIYTPTTNTWAVNAIRNKEYSTEGQRTLFFQTLYDPSSGVVTAQYRERRFYEESLLDSISWEILDLTLNTWEFAGYTTYLYDSLDRESVRTHVNMYEFPNDTFQLTQLAYLNNTELINHLTYTTFINGVSTSQQSIRSGYTNNLRTVDSIFTTLPNNPDELIPDKILLYEYDNLNRRIFRESFSWDGIETLPDYRIRYFYSQLSVSANEAYRPVLDCVLPNPLQRGQKLNCELLVSQQLILRVFDLTGREVLQRSFSGTATIDLPEGMYVAALFSGFEMVWRERVVIQ